MIITIWIKNKKKYPDRDYPDQDNHGYNNNNISNIKYIDIDTYKDTVKAETPMQQNELLKQSLIFDCTFHLIELK